MVNEAALALEAYQDAWDRLARSVRRSGRLRSPEEAQREASELSARTREIAQSFPGGLPGLAAWRLLEFSPLAPVPALSRLLGYNPDPENDTPGWSDALTVGLSAIPFAVPIAMALRQGAAMAPPAAMAPSAVPPVAPALGGKWEDLIVDGLLNPGFSLDSFRNRAKLAFNRIQLPYEPVLRGPTYYPTHVIRSLVDQADTITRLGPAKISGQADIDDLVDLARRFFPVKSNEYTKNILGAYFTTSPSLYLENRLDWLSRQGTNAPPKLFPFDQLVKDFEDYINITTNPQIRNALLDNMARLVNIPNNVSLPDIADAIASMPSFPRALYVNTSWLTKRNKNTPDNVTQTANVLAHELGHALDFTDNRTTSMGFLQNLTRAELADFLKRVFVDPFHGPSFSSIFHIPPNTRNLPVAVNKEFLNDLLDNYRYGNVLRTTAFDYIPVDKFRLSPTDKKLLLYKLTPVEFIAQALGNQLISGQTSGTPFNLLQEILKTPAAAARLRYSVP